MQQILLVMRGNIAGTLDILVSHLTILVDDYCLHPVVKCLQLKHIGELPLTLGLGVGTLLIVKSLCVEVFTTLHNNREVEGGV